VLAIFEQPNYPMDKEVIAQSLCLALDDVQDPGNLGTIIRVADWFGIEHIFCSQGTVDVYNPKTIQATMGALARVKLHYCHLPSLIASLDVPVYGTFLDGVDMYQENLTNHGLIVMGNEGNGIGDEVGMLVNKRLYIPNYPPQRETSESLNVAMATGIIVRNSDEESQAPDDALRCQFCSLKVKMNNVPGIISMLGIFCIFEKLGECTDGKIFRLIR
jgi:TrmH family RNA methyltransferase